MRAIGRRPISSAPRCRRPGHSRRSGAHAVAAGSSRCSFSVAHFHGGVRCWCIPVMRTMPPSGLRGSVPSLLPSLLETYVTSRLGAGGHQSRVGWQAQGDNLATGRGPGRSPRVNSRLQVATGRCPGYWQAGCRLALSALQTRRLGACSRGGRGARAARQAPEDSMCHGTGSRPALEAS
jgi:hypothetical protein